MESPSSAPGLALKEPFFYSVASSLHRVLHLSRDQHFSIWRRVLGLYERVNRALPESLSDLCQEHFVEALLEDEVFWGMVGQAVSREFYARATEYLPAVYATAALIAAQRDRLPLAGADQLLLAGPS
jgi:hypothetical protein